jgi:hypothetical protein
MLRGYLDHHWRTNSFGLVFANQRGNPMCMDDFRNRELNPILRKLGIDVKLRRRESSGVAMVPSVT